MVLQRANELARELTAQRPRVDDALKWIACDPEIRALHTAMLPMTLERRKEEYDIDLLLRLAKLDDAGNLGECPGVPTTPFLASAPAPYWLNPEASTRCLALILMRAALSF